MITRNLWTSKGLVNGARGIVKKIWYKPGADPKVNLPAVVFVQVDGYSESGIHTPGWPAVDPSWAPVVPVTARWESKTGKSLARSQLPLTLAWAITIHKSQGLTLERVVIELGLKEFSLGLSFVAMSRVKRLSGLAFKTAFAITRLQKPSSQMQEAMQRDVQRRENLPFQFNDYGVNLDLYQFL
ncbi:hypothetical protein M422DRAFT_262363 [Sphaerobolus stellatus SS14]|uniref:ATP-dependent DNA helicase n=1 Tax=Sphaerobolus stellatus (strain SS14) TaxID=990650 RepID=A0A0C9VD11_SPHS4|nr:hypothetical protein M422DRAFT_262363 [Sphaerobolus stellatus SS14]